MSSSAFGSAASGVVVDVWSDIACPFCYLGRAQFRQALAGFEHSDRVEVRYHSFLLSPDAPVDDPRDVYDFLAQEQGVARAQAVGMLRQLGARAASLGLGWDTDRQILTHTGDAHRLIHFARTRGREDELIDRLYSAHFAEGLHVGHRAVLIGLAAEVGLDPSDAEEMLDGDAYQDDVDADIARARDLGIRGVPFFVYDERYAVSGAQAPAVHGQALETAWNERLRVAT